MPHRSRRPLMELVAQRLRVLGEPTRFAGKLASPVMRAERREAVDLFEKGLVSRWPSPPLTTDAGSHAVAGEATLRAFQTSSQGHFCAHSSVT